MQVLISFLCVLVFYLPAEVIILLIIIVIVIAIRSMIIIIMIMIFNIIRFISYDIII